MNNDKIRKKLTEVMLILQGLKMELLEEPEKDDN